MLTMAFDERSLTDIAAFGHNPEIFVQKEKFLENYQCAICKWIVKDCVELVD